VSEAGCKRQREGGSNLVENDQITMLFRHASNFHALKILMQRFVAYSKTIKKAEILYYSRFLQLRLE
jgi:hypothetical protein